MGKPSNEAICYACMYRCAWGTDDIHVATLYVLNLRLTGNHPTLMVLSLRLTTCQGHRWWSWWNSSLRG